MSSSDPPTTASWIVKQNFIWLNKSTRRNISIKKQFKIRERDENQFGSKQKRNGKRKSPVVKAAWKIGKRMRYIEDKLEKIYKIRQKQKGNKRNENC
jgi:hypothetical protein